MKNNLFPLLFIILLISSCSTPSSLPTRESTYANLYQQSPITIMLMPPINRSTKVEAKELFYSSLIIPLTQRGYYVLPPLLTMTILQEESAYDTELYINNSIIKAGELFGADAALFTIIHSWEKSSISGIITVDIEYILKSAKNDESLFHRRGEISLNIEMNTGSILGDLIGTMIATAMTKEIGVARSCNVRSFLDIPFGAYSPYFNQDKHIHSMPKEFKETITKTY